MFTKANMLANTNLCKICWVMFDEAKNNAKLVEQSGRKTKLTEGF